jgi:hypothetical protein
MAGYGAKGIRKVGAFRSGLEDKVSKQLESKGVTFDYELWRIPYVIPASDHLYTPDFLSPTLRM